MKLIPVMDVRGGIVVHGQGGDRAHYPPVPASFSPDSSPLAVARVYKERYGFTSVYVADLDAIERNLRETAYLETVSRDLGFEIWLDAGVNTLALARTYLAAGVSRLVVGTETLENLAQLDALAREISPDHLVVSLDLKAGRIVTRCPDIRVDDVGSFLTYLRARGLTTLLVLDLSAVGSQGGVFDPVARLGVDPSEFAVYLGGGLKDASGLPGIAATGARGILAATVFYKGVVQPDQVGPYRE